MKTIYKILILLSGVSIIESCKPKFEEPTVDKGSIDVTTYVAIGNSITAGYADNALYYDGQQVSYAQLLANKFAQVGGGTFTQPLVDPASVGVGSLGNARYGLTYATDCKGVTALSPKPIAASGDLTIFNPMYAGNGPFHNMGVPGAKAITVVFPGYGNPANGLGNYNPFFTRMASNPATASMLSDAAALQPTFFTLFIGNNDVLGYATSGGTSDAITPSAGTPGVGFDASIDAIIAQLSATASKGVVANIPYVTSLPYFTTVPYNGLVLDATQAAQLTAAYTALGITFTTGANPFIIEDASAPGGLRKIANNELILLTVPQDSLKCKGWGATKPIPNKYVLTATEINSIISATDAFNNKLKAVAAAGNYAFVDVNAFMMQAEKGIVFNGIEVSTTFVSGGAFSLDGIHLTPRGNALLANEFLKAINQTYGASFSMIDASKYSGVVFP
jgi:lysophospholipase L1-like esterase